MFGKVLSFSSTVFNASLWAEMQNASPAAPRPPYKDNDGNEIIAAGKFFAGVIIIFFIFFSALYFVGHWPDKIPGPKEKLPQGTFCSTCC